jgi:hypothetical protein
MRVLAKEMGPRRVRIDGIVQEMMNKDFWFCTNADVQGWLVLLRLAARERRKRWLI